MRPIHLDQPDSPLLRKPRLHHALPFALLVLLALLTMPAIVAAETLQFESQSPGPFIGTITEGDYQLSSTSGSVEPGGPFCATFPCAGSNGQFIATDTAALTLSRIDGQPFQLNSFTSFVVVPGFGSVSVTGTTSSGASILGLFFSSLPGFQINTLPASFTNLVSVSIMASGFSLNGFDAFDVTPDEPPPPPPPDTSGTPGTMQLVSDDRYVRFFGENCTELYCDPPFDGTTVPSPDFALFTVGSTGMPQTSTSETGRMSGTAAVSGYSDIGYGIGDSTYDVSFQLTARARVQLIGTLSSYRNQNFGYGESRVRLMRQTAVLFEDSANPDTAPIQEFAFDEILTPGTYRVIVKADGDVGMDGAFDFVMSADPAPPAVPLSMPLGLLGLAGALLGSGMRGLRNI